MSDKTKLPYGRLTFDGNFCDIAKCREERWGKYCPDGACSQRKVWERLKEYEDTTMSPTDVQEYKKFEDELIASEMTFNELLARASPGLRFTSVKDRLPRKDCKCLCVQEDMKNGLYTANEVAEIIADLFGDTCACNFNDIDEWLPFKCELLDACPDPGGVACWEQYLKYKYRKEETLVELEAKYKEE